MRKMEESKMVKMKKKGEGLAKRLDGTIDARDRYSLGVLGKNEGGRWVGKIRGRRGSRKVCKVGRRNQRRRRVLDKAVYKGTRGVGGHRKRRRDQRKNNYGWMKQDKIRWCKWEMNGEWRRNQVRRWVSDKAAFLWTRGKSTSTGLNLWAFWITWAVYWAYYFSLRVKYKLSIYKVFVLWACYVSLALDIWVDKVFSPYVLSCISKKYQSKFIVLTDYNRTSYEASYITFNRIRTCETIKVWMFFTCSPIFPSFPLNRLRLVRSVKSIPNDSANTWQSYKLVYTRGMIKWKAVEGLRLYKNRANGFCKHHPIFFLASKYFFCISKMSYKNHHSLPYARLQRDSIERVNLVSIEPKLLSANAINSSMTLLIRVVSSRLIPIAAVNRAIKNFWKFSNPFLVEDYGNNVFKISVACEEDLRYLCFHSPGIVLSHHAFIRLWNAHTPFNHVDIMHSSIWVQVRDLATSQNTIDNLLRISARIGHLDMIDYDIDGYEEVKVLRFKVYVSVDDPLITGVFTTQEDGLCWIKFYYENVGLVCFNCGIIGHHKEDCMKPNKRMARDSSEYLLSDWSAKMLTRSPDRPIYGLFWKNGLSFEPANYVPVKNGGNNQDEQVVPNQEASGQNVRKGGRYCNSDRVDSEETIRVGAVESRRFTGESSKKAQERYREENRKELEFIPLEVEDSSESSAAMNMLGTVEKRSDQERQLSMLIYKRMEDVSSDSGGKKRPRMWSSETLDDDQFNGVELDVCAGIEEEKGSESGSNRLVTEEAGNNLMGTFSAQKQGIMFI